VWGPGRRARSHVRGRLAQHERKLPLMAATCAAWGNVRERPPVIVPWRQSDDSLSSVLPEKVFGSDGTIHNSPYFEGWLLVRGRAAELHPPEQSPDCLPEIAVSAWKKVSASARVGQLLFRQLIRAARRKGLRSLRITKPAAQMKRCRAARKEVGLQI